MPSRRAGHFVQVFKPIASRDWVKPPPKSPRDDRRNHPNYVEVEGRTTSRTVPEYPGYAWDGWFYMSRELPRRQAVKFARAYRRAGFDSRVILRRNDGGWSVTDEFFAK
jgi:hypothetical protein